jgi:hypothetical protein
MPRAKRPGGNAGKGRPKGARNKRTIAKEMEEEILRQKIKQRIGPILDAQIANAQGIKYLVVRERKGGKFIRVKEALARAAEDGKVGEEIIEVWEKDPSVHAFTELLNRGYGKAKEPQQDKPWEGVLRITWES